MTRRAAATLGLFLLAAAALAGCGGGAPSPATSVAGDASPAFLVASADTALAAGEPEEARRLLARALAAAPESAFVHVAFGRYQTAIRRYKDAKESLERAAALEPSSPEPLYWLGRAYQQSGDLSSAAQAFAAALRLDPDHAPSAAALGPILGERYEAAGIPGAYALLRERPSLTRGELAVILGVELGADPDRAVWRSDSAPSQAGDEEFTAAWGGRWARAAAARGWIAPFADGSYHLDDPVTRAALALSLAAVERQWGPLSTSASPGDSVWAGSFPDIGPRHYLAFVARRAAADGLPGRGADGRFEPWASATGSEVLQAVRGLARRLGASPVVSSEPGLQGMVK
ncbi:MAG TPA: tetratricopeptide repeat protein [Candidatus Eisenbacteria bacterium]|nr:tetratricopeptide repeat protein [Candidatus Eisenbacteria bacterium]